MSLKLKPFSVMLAYPVCTNTDSNDTYYEFTMVRDRDHAVDKVRRKCCKANGWRSKDYPLQPGDEPDRDDTFIELLVLPGHHEGI